MSYKNHFVLVELSNYDKYPVLIPVRDYYQVTGENPTSRNIGENLERQGYKRIESDKNIIYIPSNFKIV